MKSNRAIKQCCRKLASEFVQVEYELYDQIWTDRIRITPALFDHGEDIVREINRLMPNLLVYKIEVSPLDEVAELYNFESTSALIEFLLKYTPRKAVFNRHYEALLASHLELNEIDTVPF